jgi:hypothetical protein
LVGPECALGMVAGGPFKAAALCHRLNASNVVAGSTA